MVKLAILLTLLSLFAYVMSYDNPSLVYVLNEKQLKELEKIVIEKFLLNKKLPIQDLHFKQQIDFIGTIQLDIIQQVFKFTQLSTESMNVEFIDTDRLTFTIKDVKADLYFSYDFKSSFYSNKGKGTISLGNAIVTMKNKLTSVQNTLEPQKMGPCAEILGLEIVAVDMDIKFDNEGPLEKIIRGVLLGFKDALVETIQKKFNSDYITSVNESIRSSFAKVKLSFDVAQYGLTISYSMHGSPTIQNKLLTSAFNAEIYDANYKYDAKPYHLPPITDTLSSIDILLNQFVFENLLFIMYKQKMLNWNIPSEATSVLPLTVNTFSECFPTIKDKYPNDEPVDLKLVQIGNPQAIFKEMQPTGQTALVFKSNIEFIVRTEGKNETAVAGDTTFEISLEFELKEGKISANLLALTFTQFVPTKTIIGEIKPEVFINGTKEIAELILPFVNVKLKSILEQIVIPSYLGIKFDHSNVSIHNNYLQIGASPYIVNSWFPLFK